MPCWDSPRVPAPPGAGSDHSTELGAPSSPGTGTCHTPNDLLPLDPWKCPWPGWTRWNEMSFEVLPAQSILWFHGNSVSSQPSVQPQGRVSLPCPSPGLPRPEGTWPVLLLQLCSFTPAPGHGVSEWLRIIFGKIHLKYISPLSL